MLLLLCAGVLPGAVDYYITGPLQRKRAQAITKADLKLGKLLGSGGFGSVYKAVLTNEDGTTSNVIVKKVDIALYHLPFQTSTFTAQSCACSQTFPPSTFKQYRSLSCVLQLVQQLLNHSMSPYSTARFYRSCCPASSAGKGVW